MNIIVYLLVAFAVYVLWLPTVKMGSKRVSCSRSFDRRTAFAGEEGELEEIIRNDSPFLIPWLRLESRISPWLRLGSQENLDVRGDMYYCSVFAPMPYQQIRRVHKVKFLRRGLYDLGSASMTVGDMLDVLRIHRPQSFDACVTVYPRLLDPDQLPDSMSRPMGVILGRRRLLEDPFLVRSIRPYHPGDPVRDIHWPATARTQEVQLRLHDHTISPRLLVVLNGQCQQVQWSELRMDHMEDRLEYGISLAATLCVQCLRSGLEAGFATNMPLLGSSQTVVLPPQSGIAQEERLLENMACLDTSLHKQKIPAFLEALEIYTDLDILLLSCYDSPEIREGLLRLARQGNRVSFHLLEGDAV